MYQRLPPTFDQPPAQPPGRPWPRPPAALPAAWLDRPPTGARITVAGLVLLRQRPGTAKGVIFMTLEDETGTVNVIVWKAVYEQYRRAVIAGRLVRVTGRLQCQGPITHVIAEVVEDISHMLDRLVEREGSGALLQVEGTRAADQPGRTYPDPRTAHAPWED